MKFFLSKAILLAALVCGMASPSSAAEDAPMIVVEGETAKPVSFLRGTKSTGNSIYNNYNDHYIQLKVDDGKCLSFDKSNKYLAKLEKCSGKDNQLWYYEHGSIKTKHNNFKDWCLTYDTHDHEQYLYLAKCDKGLNQAWLYNEKDYRFYTKSDSSYCMDYCRDCGHFVHTRKCHHDFNKDQQYKIGKKFFDYGTDTHYDNDHYIELKVDDGKCLSFDKSNKNFAKIEKCSGEDNQLWYYEHGSIKTKHNNFKDWCLTYNIHDHEQYLYLAKCDKGLNQAWVYNEEDYHFQTKADQTFCMDYCRNDCGGDFVHTHKCANHKDQQYKVGKKFFDYDNGHKNYGNDYYIQLKVDEGKCLSFDKNNKYYAKIEKCSGKDEQLWYYDGSIRTKHAGFKDWCLTYDTHDHDQYLYLARCDKGLNQAWSSSFMDSRFYTKSDSSYCMDYCRDCGDFVHIRKCDHDHSKDQQYKVGNKFYTGSGGIL